MTIRAHAPPRRLAFTGLALAALLATACDTPVTEPAPAAPDSFEFPIFLQDGGIAYAPGVVPPDAEPLTGRFRGGFAPGQGDLPVTRALAPVAPFTVAVPNFLFLPTSILPAEATFDVIPAATWDAMTAADFAAYDVIFIPESGSHNLTASRDSWGAAATGNVVLATTHDRGHTFSRGDMELRLRNALRWAGGGGGTGLVVFGLYPFRTDRVPTVAPFDQVSVTFSGGCGGAPTFIDFGHPVMDGVNGSGFNYGCHQHAAFSAVGPFQSILELPTGASGSEVVEIASPGIVQLNLAAPASLNPRSKGVIPVQVLTDADFDATTLDASTAAFGPNGASEAHGRAHVEDVDLDGDMDVVLHFSMQDTGIACGDTEAVLNATTTGGTAATGTVTFRTVGCKK